MGLWDIIALTHALGQTNVVEGYEDEDVLDWWHCYFADCYNCSFWYVLGLFSTHVAEGNEFLY
jgi:hypothetical protein